MFAPLERRRIVQHRAIPRFGYQSDDVLDEPITLDHASAEAWLNAIVQGRNPPAEVRTPD